MTREYEWKFEGSCPNCGHDDSWHDWGGGGMTNVSIMYCKHGDCDCAYWDGQDKPDDPQGWTGGKSGVTL